jgi:nicotinamidase/pyrazinamidase
MAHDARPPSGPRPGDALVVVDVQNDFMPGGALGVRDGDRVIAPLNRAIERFVELGLPVLATRDWHPADHCSFTARGGPWPPHCVAGTPGAAFAPALRLPTGTAIVSKGTNPSREAYSAFAGTDLEARLREARAVRLIIGGLATDYCVVSSTADARALGLEVVVLTDAIAAVDASPGDGERALERMRADGAALVDSRAWCRAAA